MKKKISLISVFLFLFSSISLAQLDRNIIKKNTQTDLSLWHFGFFLGMNMADFTTLPNGEVDEDGNTWYAASAGMTAGFTVGMIVDIRCAKYLNVRFTPALNLGERFLNYTAFDAGGNKVVESHDISIKTTTVDLPFYVKYSAKRYGNIRPYLIAGGGPQFNLNLNPEEPILLNAFDVQISFGVGVSIYTEYFKFCPEIKFGFGLLDQLNRDHPEMEDTKYEIYTSSLDKLTSRVLTLTFNFE